MLLLVIILTRNVFLLIGCVSMSAPPSVPHRSELQPEPEVWSLEEGDSTGPGDVSTLSQLIHH